VTAVGKTIQLTTTGFLNYDMNKKVILNIELPALDENYVLRTFHVLPRAQSTISHVNAAFLIKKTSASVWDLTEKPRFVFGGIGASFVHAVGTENYLNGKNILDAGVVTQAISTLNGEVRPEEVKPGASVDYRKKLAVGLFYKFLLGLDPEKVSTLFVYF
jgi:xanthine dehydrogenase/oxidase